MTCLVETQQKLLQYKTFFFGKIWPNEWSVNMPWYKQNAGNDTMKQMFSYLPFNANNWEHYSFVNLFLWCLHRLYEIEKETFFSPVFFFATVLKKWDFFFCLYFFKFSKEYRYVNFYARTKKYRFGNLILFLTN